MKAKRAYLGTILIALLATAAPAVAADKPATDDKARAASAGSGGFLHWSAADLKTQESKLIQALAGKNSASQQLASRDGQSATMSHRLTSGEAEVHDGVTDIFYVHSGKGAFVIGGKVVDGKTPRPGEVRGPAIDGGARKPLAVGDIIVIPPKTPHQIVLAPGERITYLVMKVTGARP
jgi:mannose-6-phosphate isomerase-like protein (cupin superfamily)